MEHGGLNGILHGPLRGQRIVGIAEARRRSGVGAGIDLLAAADAHLAVIPLQQAGGDLRRDLGRLTVVDKILRDIPGDLHLLGQDHQAILAGDGPVGGRNDRRAGVSDGDLTGLGVDLCHIRVPAGIGEAGRVAVKGRCVDKCLVAVAPLHPAAQAEAQGAGIQRHRDHRGILGGVVVHALHFREWTHTELILALVQTRDRILRRIRDAEAGPGPIDVLRNDVLRCARRRIPGKTDAVGRGLRGEVTGTQVLRHHLKGQHPLTVVGTIRVAHDADPRETHVHVVLPVGHVIAVGGLGEEGVVPVFHRHRRPLGLAGIEAVLVGQGGIQRGDVLALQAADLPLEGIRVEDLTGADMVLVVEVALPALFRHLEELVAVLAPAAKVAVLPALRRVDGLGVMDEAILPGVMDHVLAHRKNARHEGARVEVDLSALPVQGVTGIAGISRGADVVAAIADQAAAAVPLVAVAVVLAALLLGEAVQQLRVPAAVVISLDAQGVAGGGERQIDRVIIALQLDKVERLIIRDPVGFLAQGTADEVGDALLVVHCAVVEGLRPGVRMVVSGQDHIDPGLLRRRIDLLLGSRAHTGHRIGVVDRLVHDQDLPGCVGRLGVSDQLGQGLGGEAIIGQSGHENVAVDRAVVVAVALVVEGGVGVAAAVLLVVAHGEEAAAGQPVQHGEGLVPVAVVAAVVHQVAGLDGQVIVRQIQPVQDAGQRRVLALLQVAEDQRLHVGVDIARGEAADLRPVRPVAHLIVVGGAGLQVLRLGAADIGRRAVREGQQAAGAVIDRALRQGVLALRQAQLGALGRLGGVCQPAHVQAVGTVGGIAPDMGGRSVRLALGQVDGSRQGGGNAALAVSGRHRQVLLLPVDRDEHLALRVRGPQQRLALIEPHAQGRQAGGRMGDEEVAGLRETHHHSAGAHGVGRRDGQGDGAAEAHLLHVLFHNL